MAQDVLRELFVGETTAGDGTTPYGRATRTFEQAVTQVHGRHYEQASRGNIFFANTLLTGKVIYTTEAATGGPVLLNLSGTHNASILGIGFGVYTAADADGAIGLTGSYGYSATFATSSAITTQGCLLVNSSTPRMEVYSSATTNTNRWFMPLGSIVTAALNLGNSAWNWIDLGGMVVVPSGSAIAVSVSEAIADIDMEITMVWEEVPA